jgi:hypothetical protein
MPTEPQRTELSSDPADYLTGPTSDDAGHEGGTTKDGAVAVYPRQSTVRPVDQQQQSGEQSGDSGS